MIRYYPCKDTAALRDMGVVGVNIVTVRIRGESGVSLALEGTEPHFFAFASADALLLCSFRFKDVFHAELS